MTRFAWLTRWVCAAAVLGFAQPAFAQADMNVSFPLDPLWENGTNLYPVVITNDPDNNAVLTVTGSNPELTPADSITVLGTGANRLVVYRPPFDKSGITNLTFTLSDPGVVKIVEQNGLQVFAATAVPRPPSAVSSIAGAQATFQWTPAAVGAASDLPSYYLLEIGDAPGLSAFAPIRIPARTLSASVTLPRAGYNFRLRPGNRLGLGPVSPEGSVGVAMGPDVPGPPGGVAIGVSPTNVATLTWTRSGFGASAAYYIVELGSGPGLSDLGRYALPPTFTVSAPLTPGSYVLRMRGVSAAGEGPASPDIFLTVPDGSCAAPSAPVLSTILKNGPTLLVPWSPPTTGKADAYQVVAGSTPGAGDLAVALVGPGSSAYAIDPPAGTYYIFVQALSNCGPPVSSSVVTHVEPAPAAPGAPHGFVATTSPGAASFAWHPPVTGSRVETYELVGGMTPGASDIVVPLNSNVPGISMAGIPPGTYYVRVRARNAFGVSSQSNELTLTIP